MIACLATTIISCNNPYKEKIDYLNEISYNNHYRNLDSTSFYADSAISLAATSNYGAGKAEALNNKAFVSIAKMDYYNAAQLLDSAMNATNNEVELLISDVQEMRLCQRRSENKNFYFHYERAKHTLHAIESDKEKLSPHWQKRYVYGKSEMSIVASTYFYYVGIDSLSRKTIYEIDEDDIKRDTAQLLNYYYNIGAGGIINGKSDREIYQEEFDYLLKCYIIAKQNNYIYWQANALQGISEHLQEKDERNILIKNNLNAIQMLNTEAMPYDLLAGNLSLRALYAFKNYGDIYQLAGAYRTLSECYWAIGDNQSALICLNKALKDHRIKRAPDLVSSIRERLSLVFSAINNKQMSDYNRNIYLDIQERTRQDRQLEARIDQLDYGTKTLNAMIGGVVAMIVIIIILLFVFDRMRRRKDRNFSIDTLLFPLNEWKDKCEEDKAKVKDEIDFIKEEYQAKKSELSSNRKINLEQRAKVSLANSILPLIDRMALSEDIQYIADLSEEIDRINAALTSWIEIKRGTINLHIQSFYLNALFSIVKKSRFSFEQKGIHLIVKDTDAIVKGDRTLTLFMINTIADNAKKFTEEKGQVIISAIESTSFVEICIQDTGYGMTSEQVENLFNTTVAPSKHKKGLGHGYGFGLLNCKGIIDKYRKISKIFNVCQINAESIIGKGSKISFRLPKGIMRISLVLIMTNMSILPGRTTITPGERNRDTWLIEAQKNADKAYYCNILGHYDSTLIYAKKCLNYINKDYSGKYKDNKLSLTLNAEKGNPAELVWKDLNRDVNYNVILDVRNETAIAALALHNWKLYDYNNDIYTKLFRKESTDIKLGEYVKVMKKQESNKNISIALLILLMLIIFPAYYLIYYRRALFYKSCIERIKAINEVLLGDESSIKKIQHINKIWNRPGMMNKTGTEYEHLQKIVKQIINALHQDIEHQNKILADRELAKDYLHKIQLDNDKIYINNSILDNCFSSLKHETMYYPSRIYQLCKMDKTDIREIKELIEYYKDLYTLLTAQANDAVKAEIELNNNTMQYLIDLLCNHSENRILDITETNTEDKKYAHAEFFLKGFTLNEQQLKALFTPLTINKDFFICRQIIREIGEKTNSRGCGIQALESCTEGTRIKIDITKKIWKNLKLL